MASSRDDSIIAIRSAFLKKSTQQKFSLLTLILLSVIILFLNFLNLKIIDYAEIGLKEIIYRSSSIASIPEKYTKKFLIIVNDHMKNFEEIKDQENLQDKYIAEQRINEYLFSENDRLRRIIGDINDSNDEVIAKILFDKESPFLNSIVLNKGSKDNIKLGNSVLNGKYLIGKVFEVNYTSSRVILLNDINSKIPSIIEPAGIHVLVSGTGKDKGVIEYLKDDFKKNLSNDLNIFTSGVGGVFRSGIPIGKLNIDNQNNKIFVNFFSDFSQLGYVKIISGNVND